MKPRWENLAFATAAVFVALAFTSLVLVTAGASPFEAYWYMLKGSLGSWSKISDVLVAWVPLLLATAGLLITFAAGLWNIGVEGQIVLGGIFTTWVLRLLQDSTLSPAFILILAIAAGALGGALWAALAGVLKVFGGVNEIFGGLGLDFVAVALTLWLIFGPWKRPGIGSMSGTEPFPKELWLPTIPGSRLSLWALFIGLVSIAIVYFLLSGTYFGLKLKAVGKNPRAAYLLGIPTTRYLMMAFVLSGLFAGLAGAVQVTAVYHRLIPAISSGYGWLGLMVSMLINFQPAWAAPVTFFFAALNIGSIQLPIVLKLDSSLSGVLQGALVLSFLLMGGVRQRWLKKHQQEASDD
ncbi:MAG: ABC transporter permease [Chloroflexi bacterium]|nr:ABC transporter permease [Chloroflexota bacterium]